MTVFGVVALVVIWLALGILYAWIKLGARAERFRAWGRGDR